MAVVIADRVKVRSFTNGTGPLTLGPTVPGFQSFEAVGNGNETYYSITSNANEWEVGRGTYTKVGIVETLTRDTIISSSNNNLIVNFTGGGKNVFCTLPSSVAQSFITGSVSDSFKTISVATQPNVVADSATDTLTLVAGTGIDITTNALTDTITISNTSSLGSIDIVGSTISTNDSSGIVIDQAVTLESDVTVGGDILPKTNNGGRLGSPDIKWSELFVSTGSIYIGDIKLSNVAGKLVATKVINPGTEEEAEDPEDSDATSNITSGDRLVNGDNEIVLGSNGDLTFPGNSLTIGNALGAPSIVSAPDLALNLVSSGNNANTVLGWIDDLNAPTQQAVVVANNPLYVGEGDVGIVTGNSLNVEGGTGYIWNFDNTGTLTLPAGSTIKEVPAPIVGNAILLTPSGGGESTQALKIYPTEGGEGDHLHLTANGGNTELYLGDDNHYVKLVDGGDVEIRTDDMAVESAVWTFGTDGNLTLPAGGDILDSSGNSVLGGLTVSKFVMVNVEGTVWGSDDGENWTGPYDTGLSNLNRVAVGPSMVVYIANHDPGDGEALYYASAWNSAPTLIVDPGAQWRQVRYFTGIGRFIAVGQLGGIPVYKHSTDGITWTTVSLDTEWAGSLDGGNGYGEPAVLTDVATNGTGFLFTTDNTVLGSFYTTTLTSDINIGENEWLNDGMSFDEVVYAASGAFTGWFAFGDGNTGAGDGWWYNDSNIPGLGSFVNDWGINDISQAFAALGIGYEPDWSELTIGSYNGVDTIVIATTNGQILYWPVIPDGPFVSIPKPYTNTDISISNASTAVLTVNSGPGVAATGEKITISLADPAEFNGVYYVGAGGELYTDIARTAPLDSTFAGGWLSGTVTFSHGQYIDALNYANGKFYVGNDDEEVFVSADGGETWTEVASLTGAPGEGEGLGYMNDVDGLFFTSSVTTGDVTFDQNKILGTGNDAGSLGLYLSPGTEVNPNKYFRIRAGIGDDASHLHFDVSDNTVYDQYFGDDDKYLKLDASGDIYIRATDVSESSEWAFNRNGSLTFPDSTVQNTAYTGINTVTPTPGTFPTGIATAITVTNSPNANWITGTGALANGINFVISVDGSGNATVPTISDGGTGHYIGETFGPVPGTAFGGTSPADDMYFEVTNVASGSVTALDLTKQVQILDGTIATGAYSLANGVEGQIMYFVPKSTLGTYTPYVNVANARVLNSGTGEVLNLSDYSWVPFSAGGESPRTISMAIFAGGAWCLQGGTSAVS